MDDWEEYNSDNLSDGETVVESMKVDELEGFKAVYLGKLKDLKSASGVEIPLKEVASWSSRKVMFIDNIGYNTQPHTEVFLSVKTTSILESGFFQALSNDGLGFDAFASEHSESGYNSAKC